MKQQKIVNQLQNGEHEKAFEQLYHYFPKIQKYIRLNSGSKDEALDIFQEALIILYKKVKLVSEKEDFKVDGFLINTCKLLWSNELRKKKVRQKSSDAGLEFLAYQDEIQHHITQEQKLVGVDSILQKLGEKCKNILIAFYYSKQSMESIAKRFGFNTIQSAKVQKYKCMETARNLALKEINLNQL
jgi:RNA polymerase sigma factor (sigma-70 family)